MARHARTRHYSGGPWELAVGYCRGTRIGDLVAIAGSTAMKDGALVGPDDAAAQTRQTLETIGEALTTLGSSFEDVYRYRIYVTRMSDVEAVSGVLSEYFGKVHPSGTLVCVAALMTPEILVEIEVDAMVDSASPVGS